MRILTLDFETKDPYIGLKLGPGWVYAYNVENHLFKALGAAIRTHDEHIEYVTDWNQLRQYIDDHDAILCHNAPYDVGILKYLYKGTDTEKVIDSKVILDTKLLFKLYDSTLMSYSLDPLAKKYLGIPKGHNILVDAVWENDLYPWLKKEINAKNKAEKAGEVYERTMPDEKKILKWAYSNMDVIQGVDYNRMADYAISDIDNTYKLYQFVVDHVTKEQIETFSDLTHVCLQYRQRGVRVDIKQAKKVHDSIDPILAEKCKQIYDIAGMEFNINSPKELPAVFDKLGIKYPYTATGRPSITSPWLEKREEPICKAIVEARKYRKIQGDFIKKIIDIQEFTCPDGGDYGMVYPSLNILEARTGRFSCTNPNLQQIPSRDEVLGPLCKSIFVPFEGEKWFSLDFSNQEGRLVVHYASALGCEGIEELVLGFKKDPNLDMHQMGAELAGITRSQAKGITLGVMYGMGVKKLGEMLGLTTSAAKLLRDKYDTFLPFLSQLNEIAQKLGKERGYVKTLSGRKSKMDPPLYIDGELKTFDYKALNKLIQGSAADQTIAAMVWAYKEGLPVLFPVHDSFEMSGTKEQAERLRVIMEEAVTLSIPMVADGNMEGGNSWNDAK